MASPTSFPFFGGSKGQRSNTANSLFMYIFFYLRLIYILLLVINKYTHLSFFDYQMQKLKILKK